MNYLLILIVLWHGEPAASVQGVYRGFDRCEFAAAVLRDDLRYRQPSPYYTVGCWQP